MNKTNLHDFWKYNNVKLLINGVEIYGRVLGPYKKKKIKQRNFKNKVKVI